MDKPSRVVADDIWPKLISSGFGHAQHGYFATKPDSWAIMPQENIWVMLLTLLKILTIKQHKSGAQSFSTGTIYMRLRAWISKEI